MFRRETGMELKIEKPAEIEAESMRIIEGELNHSPSFQMEKYDDTKLAVIKRIIHASADFDFAETIRFIGNIQDIFRYKGGEKGEAGERGDQGDEEGEGGGAKAFGQTVISDTNMILSGISKPALSKLSLSAVCFMGEAEIAETAKKRGITRAVASMEKAALLYPEGIYLIGNAPTALIRLCELIEEGKARPGLVIGVPVGFVNVTESKEYASAVCERNKIPAILTMGRKGGSTVAVSAFNALMYRILR